MKIDTSGNLDKCYLSQVASSHVDGLNKPSMIMRKTFNYQGAAHKIPGPDSSTPTHEGGPNGAM